MSQLRSSIIRKYQKAVDGARLALADDITIYYRTGNKLTVSADEWDPVNQELLNVEQATDGNYYMDEIVTKTIKATTSRLGLSDKYIPLNLMGGQINRNDVIISCKLEDVLNSMEYIYH